MVKAGRHTKIIELIHKYQVETQEELASYLRAEGYDVTQATVSRDIRNLKLTKIQGENGRQRYALQHKSHGSMKEKHMRVLKEGYLSMDVAQNILVVKTMSGMAMAVCAAIDGMEWEEIVGSVAGDDTIICVVRSKEAVGTVMEKIRKII